jgi:hypothetical protein
MYTMMAELSWDSYTSEPLRFEQAGSSRELAEVEALGSSGTHLAFSDVALEVFKPFFSRHTRWIEVYIDDKRFWNPRGPRADSCWWLKDHDRGKLHAHTPKPEVTNYGPYLAAIDDTGITAAGEYLTADQRVAHAAYEAGLWEQVKFLYTTSLGVRLDKPKPLPA